MRFRWPPTIINRPFGTTPSPNYDFDVVDGTLNFPAPPAADYNLQPIHINIPISKLTKFNKDFRLQLYRNVPVNGGTETEITGMNSGGHGDGFVQRPKSPGWLGG